MSESSIMKPYLISVVIPAYNEEECLPGVLSALSHQDYPNYEIIVVDNASSDSSAKVADKYANKVLFEPRRGLSYARQRGFSEAKGEVIVKADADTKPYASWLSDIYKVFSERPDAVAVSGPTQYSGRGEILKRLSKYSFIFVVYISRFLLGHFPLNGPGYAVRRSALKKIQPHMDDSLVHEDMDLSCHLEEYGEVLFNHSIVINGSARRFKSDPLFVLRYVFKTIVTVLYHHPGHNLHRVS